MREFVTILACAMPCLSIAATAQDIVPDGTTATSVAAQADGRSIVDIAPRDVRGTSLNRFSKFDVPRAGVALDNQNVGASTIVSEVTSLQPTRLEGPLSVIGPSAHIVIANPNGIVADGATFNNVNAVALATASYTAALSGEPRLSVSRGTIEVGSGGLSGVMSGLDLLARDIRIAGSVRAEHPTTKGRINIAAGRSTSTLGSGTGAFVTTTPEASSSPAAGAVIAVDISGEAQLKAGSIRVHVTEAGAGVRLAGDAIATAGDVRIGADGHVRFSDAQIRAHGAVSVSAASVAGSSKTRRSEISSVTSGVTIRGRDGVSLSGVSISGVERDFGDFASLGGVTLLADQGDIDLAAADAFETTMDASRELIALTAGGDVTSSGVTMRSAHDVQISAAGSLITRNSIIDSDRTIALLSSDEILLADAELLAKADIQINGASVGIHSSQEHRTKVVAASGAVSIAANGGSIVNQGSLIEGRRASLSNPGASSAVTLTAADNVINQSLSLDRLGVFFGRDGDLDATAGGKIENLTARLFSNASVTVTYNGGINDQNAIYSRMRDDPEIDVNGRNNIYTLTQAHFWDAELCQRALGYGRDEVIRRLEGQVPLVRPLMDGVYLVLSTDRHMSYDDFKAMNDRYKPILGLI